MLFFTGIFIWGAIFVLAMVNQSLSLNLNYINGTIGLTFPIFVLLMVILSALATTLVLQVNISDLEKKVKQQSRKTEKAGIIQEESEDKIKLLEGKILTLEKALSEALKRK